MRNGFLSLCWGTLRKVERPKAVQPKPQVVAEKKLAFARQMVTVKTKALKRLATSLRFWENRASYYARRASMTDAELEAMRAKQKARPDKKLRRAVKMGGGL